MLAIINSSASNILVQYIVQNNLVEAAKKYFNNRFIDIGCGTKPYKDFLAPYVSDHIDVAHQETMHDKSNIDRFGTAYDIPAKDNELDCALCTAVLEHLEEPELALKECWRVLKRGTAIYTVPNCLALTRGVA
jgi:ubiquinone/menaquinone biosynthesis C-methylase UbiE